MSTHDLLRPLKGLAHETRLAMIELLLSQSLCVGALARSLGISKAAASQHLQILRKAGLVKGEKRGYWTHYLVQTEELERLADRLVSLQKEAAGPQPLPCDPAAGHGTGPNKPSGR